MTNTYIHVTTYLSNKEKSMDTTIPIYITKVSATIYMPQPKPSSNNPAIYAKICGPRPSKVGSELRYHEE